MSAIPYSDYNAATGGKTAGVAAAAVRGPAASASEAYATPPRPGVPPAVEEFLHLLARAIQKLHTYPPASPLCADAIAACHKALVSHDGFDRIEFRVTPRELVVSDIGIGSGTIVEQELVRRLHLCHVAALTIERAASPRDLGRFCADLLRDEDHEPDVTLAELLTEHGVDKIVPRMAERPEVIDLGAPPAPLCDLAARERDRREAFDATGGPAIHLYPPDKGWVRLDPASRLDTISLVDLAVLVDDPIDVATMLLRLTGDQPSESDSREVALERKFSDVTRLFAALDPRLARVMFAKLARAVLDLEPERRKALLQRTILPGLLDGKTDGTVLRDFPDVDLAESLCLLLDLETAAPEVLSAALDRLDLPAERRQAMIPLLETRLSAREAGRSTADPGDMDSGADRHARKLVRIDPADGKSFSEFMGFDLSIDAQASATIARIRGEIGATDLLVAQLRCLSSLVRLEPNPVAVEQFLARSSALLVALERAGRWRDVASWVARQRQLAHALRSQRPDVAEAIAAALQAYCTRERLLRLVDLHAGGGEDRTAANALASAFGAGLAPACVALLDDPNAQTQARALADLMCEHAALLAPQLVARISGATAAATRTIIRVLSFAGPGYENAIGDLLARPDESVVREALRALARIGTPQAAAFVAAQIRQGLPWVRAAAEEALWRFPPSLARPQLRDLIGRREFVLKNPAIAARLLERAKQIGKDDLGPMLGPLVSLRFRFWNPALVRVARAARELLNT